jgi:hypothetical protein
LNSAVNAARTIPINAIADLASIRYSLVSQRADFCSARPTQAGNSQTAI